VGEAVARVGRLVTVYLKVFDAKLVESETKPTWLQIYGEMFDEVPRRFMVVGRGWRGVGLGLVGKCAGVLSGGEMPVTIRIWSTDWHSAPRMFGLDASPSKSSVEQKMKKCANKFIVICNAEIEFPGYMDTNGWVEDETQPPTGIGCRAPMTTVRVASEQEWKDAWTLNTRLTAAAGSGDSA